MKNNKIKLFIVDDDILYLKSLEIEFLQNKNLSIESFISGEECIKSLDQHPDIIILDYYLNGTNPHERNGLEVLDIIIAFNSNIAVIMLSCQDSIEVAINCMHHKAFDYVVKSETALVRIHNIIATIYKYKKIEKELSWYMNKL